MCAVQCSAESRSCALLLCLSVCAGNMAVSNAIGSNVFDIFLGLGFPWSLSPFVYGIWNMRLYCLHSRVHTLVTKLAF